MSRLHSDLCRIYPHILGSSDTTMHADSNGRSIPGKQIIHKHRRPHPCGRLRADDRLAFKPSNVLRWAISNCKAYRFPTSDAGTPTRVFAGGGRRSAAGSMHPPTVHFVAADLSWGNMAATRVPVTHQNRECIQSPAILSLKSCKTSVYRIQGD